MTPDHLGSLGDVQAAFSVQLHRADLGAPVAACAPWTVADLARHLGGIYRWAAGMAQGEASDDAVPVEPHGPGAVIGWYDANAALLHGVLTRLGPDAPCPTLVGPGTAAFWHRRQLHESVIHLWDLLTAADRGLVLDPLVTADTVDEVVSVMQPRQVRLNRMAPLRVGVELRASDAERSWLLGDARAARAIVVGPSLTLALLLWRRITPDHQDLAVSGDPTALAAALSQSLTP